MFQRDTSILPSRGSMTSTGAVTNPVIAMTHPLLTAKVLVRAGFGKQWWWQRQPTISPATKTTRPYYSPIKPKPRHHWCGVLLANGLVLLVENGAPGKTRTSNPQIRSLVLYPIELRAQPARGLIARRGRGPYTKAGVAASPKIALWKHPKTYGVPGVQSTTNRNAHLWPLGHLRKIRPKVRRGAKVFSFQ